MLVRRDKGHIAQLLLQVDSESFDAVTHAVCCCDSRQVLQEVGQCALVWWLLKVLIVIGIVLACVFKLGGRRPYFFTFLFYATAPPTWLVYVDWDVAVVVWRSHWMSAVDSGGRVVLLRLLVTRDRFCELNLGRLVLIGLGGREILGASLVHYFIRLGYFLPYPLCLLYIAHHLRRSNQTTYQLWVLINIGETTTCNLQLALPLDSSIFVNHNFLLADLHWSVVVVIWLIRLGVKISRREHNTLVWRRLHNGCRVLFLLFLLNTAFSHPLGLVRRQVLCYKGVRELVFSDRGCQQLRNSAR